MIDRKFQIATLQLALTGIEENEEESVNALIDEEYSPVFVDGHINGMLVCKQALSEVIEALSETLH